MMNRQRRRDYLTFKRRRKGTICSTLCLKTLMPQFPSIIIIIIIMSIYVEDCWSMLTYADVWQICIYIHIFIFLNMYVYIYIYAHTYTHIYIYTHTYIYIYIYNYIHFNIDWHFRMLSGHVPWRKILHDVFLDALQLRMAKLDDGKGALSHGVLRFFS